MDNKFKEGDKVVLIANTSSSCNKIGDVGIVSKVAPGSQNWYKVEVEGNNTTCNNTTCNWSKESDLELYKVQPIIINSTENTKEVDYIMAALEVIIKKDYEFSKELAKLITYLASTYADKYENTDNYSKRKLLSEEGKSANVFTALKYIQRYDTVGYSKSENPQDLLKAIHYCLFENQRKNKYGNSN